ncbi:MAG: TolC family protein [Lepagella sp.]
MIRRIFFTIIALMTAYSLSGQEKIQDVLRSIETNNTSLAALRAGMEADQLANRTDIYLSDPEVGFNYLWGHPSPIGNRIDVSVSQTLDLPTIAGMKGKVADRKNDMLRWEYESQRINTLSEAKLLLIDMIYYNRMRQELGLRQQTIDSIAMAEKRKLDAGNGTIVDYNGVQLEHMAIVAEIQEIETERKATLATLRQMNGGKAISFDCADYEEIVLPIDFDSWYAESERKNPVLAYVKSEIEKSKQEVSLSRSLNLPSLTVGYMLEKTQGEHYQGISLGLSIPLWNTRNKVKQAKAAVAAAEARQEDAKIQFYGQLNILYQRVVGLNESARTYRKALTDANSSQYLKRALDVGEISVLDYLRQASLYYQFVDKAMSAERDLRRSYAELTAYEL